MSDVVHATAARATARGGADKTPGATCSAEPGCITCGDIAVGLTVVSVSGADAVCRDDQGRREQVATELVGEVSPGDRLLVHAGVAIERLTSTRGDQA